MSPPTVSPELRALLRREKLGRCLDTLPSGSPSPRRAAWATPNSSSSSSPTRTRRETTSAARRARATGLDPAMTLDRWDDTAKVTYDRRRLERAVLAGLRRGRTQRRDHGSRRCGQDRRISVHFERCDRLLKRLRASRLDNRHDVEMRKVLRVDLLIIDDFALQALDALDTSNIYELVVERHRAAAPVVRSNREPLEWLGLMANPLFAQSAIDRLQSAAHERVLDAVSYRQRQKPTLTASSDETLDLAPPSGDHPVADADTPKPGLMFLGAPGVPSSWRTTGGLT